MLLSFRLKLLSYNIKNYIIPKKIIKTNNNIKGCNWVNTKRRCTECGGRFVSPATPFFEKT